MSSFNLICPISWLTFHVLLLILLEFASCSKYEQENWVNPDDMLNYDRTSKTMIKEKNRDDTNEECRMVSKQNEECRMMSKQNEEHTKMLEEKLKICEAVVKKVKVSPPSKPAVSQSIPEPKVENIQRKKTNCRNAVGSERQYMKRFVNILLLAAGLTELQLDVGKCKQSRITIDVSSEHLTTLQQFGTASADVSLNELDEALSHILHSSDSDFNVPLGWLERLSHSFFSKDALYRLLPVGITLVTLVMLMFRRHVTEIVITFLVLIMALGYQWTYDYMLKMAEIKQYIALKKFEEIPLSCRPSVSWSLLDYVVSRFTYDDRECARYYHAHMMEPALEVTPTLVLSEMLSSMLFHPAEKLGDSVARFATGILGGLPMFHNWIVLVLTLAFLAVGMVVVVVLVCGGRLRLPFYLGGLELSGESRRVLPSVQRVPMEEVRSSAIAEPVRSATTADPMVSALSSSQGLVLMNMPVLERLMSARDERSLHRDYVERLSVTEMSTQSAGSVVGDGNSKCQSCEMRNSTCPSQDNRSEALSPITAVEDVGWGSTILEAPCGRLGEGDATGDARETLALATSNVDVGAGDSSSPPNQGTELECSLNKTFMVESLDCTLTEDQEVMSKRELNLVDDESTDAELQNSSRLQKSGFIDEIRKLLEEDLGSPSTQTNTRLMETSPSEESDERLEMMDTENLLEECSATNEPARKTSADSSDGSGDFVKL